MLCFAVTMLHLRIINCAVLLVSIAGFASAANVMYDVNCTAGKSFLSNSRGITVHKD